MEIVFRTAYDGRQKEFSAAVAVECKEKKVTKDSMRDECDVNLIMARYEKTGVLPQARPGQYVDVSEFGDFRSVIERVKLAEGVFAQLPAGVREEFGNDVASFLDFAGDPANRGALEELGVLPKSGGVVAAPTGAGSEPPVEGASGGPPAL